MGDDALRAGLHEALVTSRLAGLLGDLPDNILAADLGDLISAEASDRISRAVARLLARAIDAAPERDRAKVAIRLAIDVLNGLNKHDPDLGISDDMPLEPGRVLRAVLRRLPDGRSESIERPLTPLLDTTLLTNARGEPSVGHELRAEVHSADAIDVVMAFVRWSGVRPLIGVLRRHCAEGKPVRVLTTTYTNSTEQRALDELVALGVQVKVSYVVDATRLHAKAWIFYRESGYSTAYIGSSNLTHMAQVSGLEWNVRVSGARNPDVIAKMAAVFASYWESRDFVPYNPDEFRERTKAAEPAGALLPAIEIELRPFQEALLDQLDLARDQGHHRNLLVAATGTGKTVMAAVDYVRLRPTLGRDRLLFVAHREEILEQSRSMFQLALRDSTFGETWVGGRRPTRFEHVFASIQSLSARGVRAIDPEYFDMVIVDEFHHAAAPSYEALLDHFKPRELLGLTATPERADGLDVLRHFDGRIAAELRLWDAIDQQYLAPFAYFGIHDGLDLREVPWKRGQGYDVAALTNVYTANHVWVRRVIEEVQRKLEDPSTMRALGFCVSVDHARFMASQFTQVGLPSVAIWADTAREERLDALRKLAAGELRVVFTVDLFNEGVDVPTLNTLLFLRPTDSPTLFLQQLGRGLRKARDKTICTVLDFVGTHRKEFRFDRRFRALLGGSRLDVERQIRDGFPFLPAGCQLELDPVAQEIVLRSIREAIPSGWKERCAELRSLGDVSLGTFLGQTGLELEDVYDGNHSWTEMRRQAGIATESEGPKETELLRAIGRMLHVDDGERIEAYRSFLAPSAPPNPDRLSEQQRRLLRMLITALTPLRTATTLQDAVSLLREHPQVRHELSEVLDLLRARIKYLGRPLGLPIETPLRLHARYTRNEIQAAFDIGKGAKGSLWQTGVLWEPRSETDLFAFTLDKSVGGFSPTTRYRDYAISPELVHWESQSATSIDSKMGQRYIHQRERGTHIALFARMRTSDRAFWCLGPASYVRHEGERPIAFVWKLQQRLPADLYTELAAAVA